MIDYIGMLVVPEEEGEGEKGQVVICSLEAGKAGEDDHGEKEFLDMLDHSFELTNIITSESIGLVFISIVIDSYLS